MTFAKSFLLLAAGCGLGITFILACSDDAPGDADAACECPASEAPIAGRIEDVTITEEVPANSPNTTYGVDCPAGSILLSGGCGIPGGSSSLSLMESVQPDAAFQSWQCAWRNETASIIEVTVRASCLVPAE